MTGTWAFRRFLGAGLMKLTKYPVPYCWWFRTPANQLRLVVSPIIYRLSYICGGCLGFLPSTVIVLWGWESRFWTFCLLTFLQCVAGMVVSTLCREYITNHNEDLAKREEVYRWGVGLVGKLGAIGGKPRVAMACWGAMFCIKIKVDRQLNARGVCPGAKCFGGWEKPQKIV